MRTAHAIAAAATAVGLMSAASTARADGNERGTDKGTIGVGIILGEPTGITARIYLKDDQAIDATVGSAFVAGGLEVGANYVFHPYILQERDSFTLPLYVGPGLRLIDHSDGRDANYFAFGLRGVVGLLFDFKTVPLDAFLEVAGVVEHGLSSGHGFEPALEAGAGVRYYF
jgi:hypothetical protein